MLTNYKIESLIEAGSNLFRAEMKTIPQSARAKQEKRSFSRIFLIGIDRSLLNSYFLVQKKKKKEG